MVIPQFYLFDVQRLLLFSREFFSENTKREAREFAGKNMPNIIDY